MALLATAIGFSSCKEDIIIQTNLTPGADNIGTITFFLPDSFYTAKTVYDDSGITSGVSGFGVYHALGWMNGDTYSGNTAGSIYLQVVPTSTGFSYATNDVADSAVLVIPYSGFTWGDTTIRSEQKVSVYEIADTMSINSRYYTTTNKAVKNTLLGSASFYTGPRNTGVISDSVALKNGKKAQAHLRIKLSSAFLTDFNDRLKNNVDSFAGFLRSFRGFYIAPDSSGSGLAMPYFLMTGTTGYYGQVNMLVYGHNTTSGSDSVVYQFPLNSTYAAHYNKITRNYTDRSIFNDNSPLLLVQNQPGGAIDLTIKRLRELPIPQGVVINQASIIFTEIPATLSNKYAHPPRIYPLGIDANGVKYSTLDRYPTITDDGLRFIDATPRINGAVTTYTMNLPREFQQGIIQQKSELHLRINGTQDFPAAYRLVLGNKTNTTYKIALKIIYSKLK